MLGITKTCYLDLDGVLVDFVSGALKFHNKHIPYEQLDWDFDKKLGLKPEVFWGAFGFDFWANLSWTREGPAILEFTDRLFKDNIAIITSPPKTPGAVEGKLEWVKRNLGSKWVRRTFVGARKELLAAPSKLLVDDRDKNLEAFKKAGGCVAPVGRPWNKYSTIEILGLNLEYLEQDMEVFLMEEPCASI